MGAVDIKDSQEGETVHPRHCRVERGDVHEVEGDDVGLERRRELEPRFSVAGFADDLDIGAIGEHAGDVNDEDANRARGFCLIGHALDRDPGTQAAWLDGILFHNIAQVGSEPRASRS